MSSAFLKKLSDDYIKSSLIKKEKRELSKARSINGQFKYNNNFATKWHQKGEKRTIDNFHYSYLAPIVRYNQSIGETTKGITLPSELWIWEQNLAKNFRYNGSKFYFLGVESSNDLTLKTNFYKTSETLNKLKTSNFKTSCHFGDITELLPRLRKSVDFIYADFTGYWARPIINFILTCFNNDSLIKKNGCFFMSVFLLRGSKLRQIREETIELGKIAQSKYPEMNNFDVFDTNSLCRQSKSVDGLMSKEIPYLARGIATFVWRQAQKNGIDLTVHNPNIYYNEHTIKNGTTKRNPMCSFYFTKNN